MRGDQLSRQWQILRRLETGHSGCTVAEITAFAGVSQRTAYRDLDDLQRAGFPIQKLIDGGIEISFRVAGLDEIQQWVMSLGEEACVIEPAELRVAMRQGHLAAAAQYGEDDGMEWGRDGIEAPTTTWSR